MKGKLAVERKKSGEYFFRLIAEDGRSMAVSEDFETLAACRSGIKAMEHSLAAETAPEGADTFGLGRPIYEIGRGQDGFAFLLKGAFGEVLAEGGGFESREACAEHVKAMASMEVISEEV